MREEDAESGRAPPPSKGGFSWQQAVQLPSFRSLMQAKIRTLGPLIALYLAFFLGTTLAAGFAKDFMTQKVLGPLNMGYALIIATYAMSWIIAMVYVRIANRDFDPKATAALAELSAARKKP